MLEHIFGDDGLGWELGWGSRQIDGNALNYKALMKNLNLSCSEAGCYLKNTKPQPLPTTKS
jgi:hypothetical protein